MGIYDIVIIMIVSFCSSVIGSVCGIGGGVIIKPVLDAIGIIPVNTIGFLSGCTVLSMSVTSVLKNINKPNSEEFDQRIGTLLGVGAAVGGLVGKTAYQGIISQMTNTNSIGAIQAALLLVITLGTLIYTVNKSKIQTHKISNSLTCILIGLILGIMSSFLGIGGGPINLVVLFYFYSMRTKQAASYSLYIIMFSQITSLISSIVYGKIPEFSMILLIAMISCGVLGGLLGASLNKRIKEQVADKLFIGLMIIIIFINIYNISKYI